MRTKRGTAVSGRCRAFTLAGLVVMVVAGCADPAAAPAEALRGAAGQQDGLGAAPSPFAPPQIQAVGDPPPEEPGVGTMGTVLEVKPQEQGLVLEQFGFDYQAPEGTTLKEVRHQFAVGGRHERLQVQVKADTKVILNDLEVTLADVKAGDKVLVVGRVTGAALHADIITDLSRLDPPTPEVGEKLPKGLVGRASAARVAGAVAAAPISLCMGQSFDYPDANILDFQGCFGGPSASDDLDTPFIPIFCPLVGCFGIDRFTYTAALGGWSYAFPIRFEATPAEALVYHVPGEVSLKLTPLPATTGAFTFAGGLGLDFGLNLDFCSFFGCYDITTIHISAFTTAHQATGAAPLQDHLDIAETSCPSIGLIPIEGIPIDPLKVGFCEDLTLDGQPFYATLISTGANPGFWRRHGFTNASLTTQVRPDAMHVGVSFGDFGWRPDMRMGLFFRFKVFMVPVWDTPTIDFGVVGPFDAIPLGPDVFTVPTDPDSPVDDLRYLYQPTSMAVSLEVAPAATVLAFTSPTVLPEGTPVTVRLAEAYDGAPIAGQPVALAATGLFGTPDRSLTATTDAQGIARLVLPVGEYLLAASYAGAETYLPTSASQGPVYLYRPTSFVVWGGNEGGVGVGSRQQFWGQGWSRQVAAGAYGGNPSFQGFALPWGGSTWVSPPAAAGHGPSSVPDLIGVIVTTEVQGRGALTTGNVAAHAVLRVEDPSSYRPDGGHAAFGVVRVLLP